MSPPTRALKNRSRNTLKSLKVFLRVFENIFHSIYPAVFAYAQVAGYLPAGRQEFAQLSYGRENVRNLSVHLFKVV
jgi:hypothetical protein